MRTLEHQHEGTNARRISTTDQAESGQAFGTTARAFTAGLVHRQQVRVVAEVQLADGRNLNAELVRAGLAW